jgi:hypothetical protein
LFKQLKAKDEAIFKQLLKTVHPGILKTTRKASSSSNTTRLLIKVSCFYDQLSKPTKDGMEELQQICEFDGELL